MVTSKSNMKDVCMEFYGFEWKYLQLFQNIEGSKASVSLVTLTLPISPWCRNFQYFDVGNYQDVRAEEDLDARDGEKTYFL